MSSKNFNAAGLTPDESLALKERSAQPHEEPIIKSIKEMYSCKPTEGTFSIYTENAVFHDPVGIAEGFNSVRAQFVALARIFSHADIPKFRILSNPPSVPSSTILIDQDVAYFRNASASSPTKTVNSLLTLETDASHKVTRHTEEWGHAKNTTGDDGFLGMLNEQRKKFTAGATETYIGKSKD